ncbi:MAG: trehalose-phosphatase [Acidimicrobiales bacterium]
MTPPAGASAGDGPLAALLEAPASSAVLSDFDGTLAPIVPDPATARPLPEAAPLLRALAERFAVVAVVSGRPVDFLEEHLATAGPQVRLFGGYGVEWAEGGVRHVAAEVEPWRPVVAEVLAAAVAGAPPGLGIEPKGWALTLHWRQSPEAGEWALAFARDQAARTGLHLQPGRLAVEFRPPVGLDKGTVVERLGRGCHAVCFAGDDAGDLAAFDALDRLHSEGTTAVRVAVADEESPPELVARADVVVNGPHEALALLGTLAS